MSFGNGKVLLKCQADCATEDILRAVDLTWADLEQKKQIVATYQFEDAKGLVKYEEVRFLPKDFRTRRPDPKNPRKWVWNLNGVTPLPYKLPSLLKGLADGSDVYITEGPKDVDSMKLAYGDTIVATTNHGGAGKWTAEHSAYFKDSLSRVVIVADRDIAGYKHAIAVQDSLLSVADMDSEIVLSKVGKDAADHVGDFGLNDFIDVTIDELTEMIRTEEITKKSASTGAISSGNSGISSGRGRLVLRKASDIVARLQKFLWTNRIPLGSLTLFAGRGGVGKSSFAIWLAVEAQHGRLPGDLEGEKVSVLYVSVEDHWETQMKPRLMAAGANMDSFYQLSIGYTEDEEGERTPSLPEDTHLIREAIEQTGAKLVILDPITSTITGDDHKRDVVRAVLDPLAKVAGDLDAVVIGIMHFNKGAGNASDKASGSHAYRDAARALLLFARDDDEDHIVMSQDKGNYAEYGDESLAYRLVDTVVEMPDGEIGHVARVVIVGDVSTSVSQIINRTLSDDTGAGEWLATFMRDNGGRVDSKDGLAAARAEGFTENQVTRARKRLRPRVGAHKTGMSGGWEWRSEEIGSPEEIPGKSEEIVFEHVDAFVNSSGDRSFIRRYEAEKK